MQSRILEIRDKSRLFYSDRLVAFMVFGSAASLDAAEKSDIDFLLILNKRRKEDFLGSLTIQDRNFHLIEITIGEFKDSHEKGDDFIVSILKNHLLLQGEGYIRQFLEKGLPAVSKKVVYDKELELKRLGDKIDSLISAEQPIAFEKIKEFIKLQCRISLMKSNIVPQSNKELFKYMKERYPEQYRPYIALKRENARDTYIKLARS